MQEIQHMTNNNWQFGYLLNEAQAQDESLSRLNDEAQVNLFLAINAEQPLQDEKFSTEPAVLCSTIACVETKSETSRSRKSSDQDWLSPDNSKRNKKITKQKNLYPTKNFLPVFKPFILGYLRLHYTDYHSHPLIRKLTSKKSINMQDFRDIFSDPKLRPILKDYFRDKKIYRDLMQSRIDYARKKQYFKRVHVFETAYLTRKFEAINKPMLQSS